MSVLTELKRRNVFKIAGAYLTLGWLVVQITATLAPAFHLPDSALPLVTWIGVIGFPFVVLFSWVYEITPDGLKRASDGSQSITHVTSKRLDHIIIGLLLLAIGLFVLQHFRPPSIGAPDRPVVAQSSAAATATTALRDPVVVAVGDKSIAVLPFADMSVEKNQEYMSDGIAEELLNLLAQVPELKVIARTSSFSFKGKDVPVAEIAQQLNVAHVLEGSVRKSGNTVRITAQLIRTTDSTHLWSETYDRPLDDIFKVQDEIANAIVDALQIRLSGGELNRRKGGTQNLEAYQLYLRALDATAQNTTPLLDAAGEYAQQAIELDPNYGLAWCALAATFRVKTDDGLLPPLEGYERTRQLAEHALQLSPDLAAAHAMLQYVHRALDWDWAAAEREGKLALAIDPSNLEAMQFAGMLSYTLGHWEDAERQLRGALVRDPLNTYVIWNLGFAYYAAGRFLEAEAMFRKLLELAPGFLWTRTSLGLTLLAQDNPEAALAMVQQEADEPNRLLLLPVFLRAAGRNPEADEALKAQIAQWAETGAYYVALNYAYRGDHDRALEWLERAYKQRDEALIEIIGEPLLKSMANDPRFKAFLRRMNLPETPVPENWQ